MDCNNYPFLEYIAKTGAPIVLSTGMCDIKEVKKAVTTIEKAGNKKICILHCISIYPPELSTINLKNILGLRKEFPDYPEFDECRLSQDLLLRSNHRWSGWLFGSD